MPLQFRTHPYKHYETVYNTATGRWVNVISVIGKEIIRQAAAETEAETEKEAEAEAEVGAEEDSTPKQRMGI